ncbi:hypothetical protein [Streptomyces sp. 4R-3d]|uniref:hypothetical protein n=1 Tax=Streptomyces sp. 4R-3d TaxID=2559605 RepID=UPI001071A74E|nr:hypothetical protein [Streptomyces sp. 4R-3d]TFI30117.1 hypothetical protein E4P36_05040 [Streptomyces sp. 4R-3d]
MNDTAEFRRLVEQRSMALDYLETSDDTAEDTRRTLRSLLDDGRLQGPKCGKTISEGGATYPPCARPASHHEAYCRDASRKNYFTAATAPTGDAR